LAWSPVSSPYIADHDVFIVATYVVHALRSIIGKSDPSDGTALKGTSYTKGGCLVKPPEIGALNPRLSPKLDVYLGGSDEVNQGRAEQCPSVAVPRTDAETPRAVGVRTADAVASEAAPMAAASAEPGLAEAVAGLGTGPPPSVEEAPLAAGAPAANAGSDITWPAPRSICFSALAS